MTFQALEAIRSSKFVVGYRPYLDLIPELLKGKEVLAGSMGKEVERARAAVDLAMEGRVALISSGDPNIYGMAGPGLEISSEVDVEVVPGVTSFTAAACRAGISFRESVAVISLSDLLTPWQRIEERLRLAAELGMPSAIYNPRSKKRNWQLQRALEIYTSARDRDVDVLVAKNVARIGQELFWTTARDLLDGLLEKIDMFTMLILSGKGMERGEVTENSLINIVGIGPGDRSQLTLEAADIHKTSAGIFGAERYLSEIKGVTGGDLAAHSGSYAERIAARFRESRLLSDRGLCSSILTGGDPSIFSSAWRIFNEARGICGLKISPGVSAFSAVAARAGAPLVNDFVLLSGPDHAERIGSISRAGFGAVVYNIEGTGLMAVLEELEPDRPCALARDVARNQEFMTVMMASDLMGARPSGFRFTLLIATQDSYIKDGRIIARRGYGNRHDY